MTPHEEFLELCAAATAGELNPDEQANLDAHLTECAECRQAMREFEIASRHGVAALASGLAPENAENDSSWSVEKAEEAFFKRLDKESVRQSAAAEGDHEMSSNRGQRFTYRPSPIRWREMWTPFAAAVLLALALSIAAYRTGIKRGMDVARSTPELPRGTASSLEEQVSDASHERAQLMAKLTAEDKVIADLRQQLSEQQKEVNAIKAAAGADRTGLKGQQPNKMSSDADARREQELAAAQTKLERLQRTIDTLTSQREELTSRAATLEAKVGELTWIIHDFASEKRKGALKD